MGDISGGNCSMKNHTLYQHDCDYSNGDVSIIYGFINSHTLSQCEYSSTFKNRYDDFGNGHGNMYSGYVF